MNSMIHFPQLIFQFIAPSGKDIVDILIVWFILYQLISLLNKIAGYQIIIGLGLLVFFYLIAVYLNLEMILSVIGVLKDYWLLVLVILFQQELRRSLAKVSNTSILRAFQKTPKQSIYAPLATAISSMSVVRTGAIIIIEYHIKLNKFIETGEKIDAVISSRLLVSIFEKNSLLHDGAVIIRKDRIVSAKVVLPLSENIEYRRKYGTRHLAAIGVTEVSDALAIVVSEEKGTISVAQNGEIESNITLGRLSQIFTDFSSK